MCIYNGFTDRKSDSHPFVAVTLGVRAGASAVKECGKTVGINAVSIVFDRDRKDFIMNGSCQFDGLLAVSVEGGIFKQVIDDLFNELCIHGNHNKGIGNTYMNHSKGKRLRNRWTASEMTSSKGSSVFTTAGAPSVS